MCVLTKQCLSGKMVKTRVAAISCAALLCSETKNVKTVESLVDADDGISLDEKHVFLRMLRERREI